MIAAVGAVLLSVSLGFSAWASKAASNAARAAQDVLKAERAWMMYHACTPEFHRNNVTVLNDDQRISYPKGIIFNIVWINAGKTPARNVNSYIETRFISMGKGVDFPIFKSPQMIGKAATVGQGQHVARQCGPIVGQNYDRLIGKQSALVIYSRAEYFDIFTPDVPRITEISLVIYCRGEKTDPKTGETYPDFDISVHGNYSTCT